MGSIKIILNPIAGRGYGARSEPVVRQLLAKEGLEFDLERTTGPGHAVELAAQAASDGFDLIVAAGGDGTTNEVVNGLMSVANGGMTKTLGILPVGSGGDFAHNIGLPADLEGACWRLLQGQARVVDVCRVTVDDQQPRYFDNTVNVGFGGIVTYEARKVKWVRGMALYLPVVLKTIFLSHAPLIQLDYDMADDGARHSFSLRAQMVCIANGAREGGGFYTAPDACVDDGLFDVCVVPDISRLAMLGLVPRFIKGTHVDVEPVAIHRARQVIIASSNNLIAHADGEVLCTAAHRLTFEMLPQKLQVWC